MSSVADVGGRPPLKRAKFSFDVEPCGDDDDDDDRDRVPKLLHKPKGCALSNAEDLPAGPQSYRECFQWNDYVVQSLLADNGPVPKRRLKVAFTSSYSGVGMAEIGLDFVSQAMARADIDITVACCSQTELDETCQACLGGQHVFGDILERVEERVVQKLTKAQEKYGDRFEKARAAAPKNASDLKQSFEDQFLKEAAKILDQALRDNKFKETAHCYRCNAQCNWGPRPTDAWWVECAGNTCTPWADRGKRRGYLDPAAIPALVWLWSLSVYDFPDIILNENVPGFDS